MDLVVVARESVATPSDEVVPSRDGYALVRVGTTRRGSL